MCNYCRLQAQFQHHGLEVVTTYMPAGNISYLNKSDYLINIWFRYSTKDGINSSFYFILPGMEIYINDEILNDCELVSVTRVYTLEYTVFTNYPYVMFNVEGSRYIFHMNFTKLATIECPSHTFMIMEDTADEKQVYTKKNLNNGNAISLSSLYYPDSLDSFAQHYSGVLLFENNGHYRMTRAINYDFDLSNPATVHTANGLSHVLLNEVASYKNENK